MLPFWGKEITSLIELEVALPDNRNIFIRLVRHDIVCYASIYHRSDPHFIHDPGFHTDSAVTPHTCDKLKRYKLWAKCD